MTSDEGYDLSTPDGVYRIRQAVKLAERESRKTSERLRRKLADRARNGQTHGSRRCFGYKIGWRGALIDSVVERIDVFPGIGKPFVDVDGVTMRFDKDRALITWRKIDTLAA